MNQPKNKTAVTIFESAVFRELRRQLLSRFGPEHLENSAPGANQNPLIREAARKLGQNLALTLDDVWDKIGVVPSGPIDVVDMFSGCGGVSSGFQAANAILPAYRLAQAIDIDATANSTYSSNLNLLPLKADISALARVPERAHELFQSRRQSPDHPLVFVGCAPCQGFSSHRNSAGESDDRNNLMIDFAALADLVKPDVVIMENVPELLTTRYWSYVSEVRSILENAGFFVHVSVQNMAEYGVPQERFRALIVAMRRPFMPIRGFLKRERFRTVREAIGFLPPVEAGEQSTNDPMHFTAKHKSSTLATIQAVPEDGGSLPYGLGPQCRREAAERLGRSVYDDIYGRLYWDRPSITITGHARNPASGRFVHPQQNRGLSVREAALLQGFPRNYAFEGTLEHIFLQVGNAVPPAFSSFLASFVLGELLSEDERNEPFRPGITSPVGSSFSRLIPGLKAGTIALPGSIEE